MYTIRTTEQFEKSLRKCLKEGKNIEVLRDTLDILSVEGTLPPEFKMHMLEDEYAGYWECHMEDDWLLVWRQNDKRLTLLLTNTGSHDELFRKK